MAVFRLAPNSTASTTSALNPGDVATQDIWMEFYVNGYLSYIRIVSPGQTWPAALPTVGTNNNLSSPSQPNGGTTTTGSSLVPTTIKTTNYTAAVNDFVPVDTTSNSVTITLPNAPADGSRVGVKHIIQGGSNSVSVVTQGSDVFNKAGGSTTLTLSLLNQTLTLQYQATGTIWYVISDDLSLGQLDLRYAPVTGIPEASVTSLTTDLSGKAASVHTHTEANVTNLTTDLAGKAASSHTHAESDVTNLGTDLAAKAPAPTVQTKTTSFTAATGIVYEVDCTSGNVTATVPVTTGLTCWIKRMDASANTISVVSASGTIDGQASLVFKTQYEGRQFIGDGTNVSAIAERRSLDVQVFSTSGTWSKPTNPLLQFASVRVIAGGGGGGSGRRGAAGTVRCGGGGGGGGGDTGWQLIPLSVLGNNETVTVGAGGSGGAAQTVDSTDGAAGGNGGTSAFGLHLRAAGAGFGSGGTATNGTGGSVGGSFWSGIAGAAASTSGAAGNNATGGVNSAATGGGAGGGITSGDAVSAGGNGGAHNALIASGTNTRAGGAGGSSPGGAGSTAAVVNAVNEVLPGNGGGGGGSSITGAGGAGAAGSRYGAGGGGGGASLNGNNSGAGGAGADGIVQVVCS